MKKSTSQAGTFFKTHNRFALRRTVSNWKQHAPGSMRTIIAVVLAVLLVSTGALHRAQAASGDLDTGFGSGGTVRTDFSGNIDQANAVAIQADGKIVAAGSSFSDTKTVEDFIVARYNANGSIDKKFGKNGKITTDFFRNVDTIKAIAIQPDGNIVVAGFAQLAGNGGNPRVFALARYTPSGNPDPSFGSGGSLTTSFGGSFAGASAIMLQPDGKIIVAGTADFNPDAPGAGLDFALVRYNSNGSIDGSFGRGGKVVFDFFGSFDQANAAALQPDGKIIVAGSASYDSFNRDIGFALARFNSNGSIDFGFGSGGKQITDFFGSGAQANGIVLQPDGKFVVAGTASDTATRPVATDFALARYNSDGSLDASFASGGQTARPFSDSATEQANAVTLAPDGKIIVAGAAFRTFATPPDFALARYNSDGSSDETFGSSGTLTTDIAAGTDIAQAVAIQADGNVVAAGRSFRSNFDLTLVRYRNEVAPTTDATPPTAPANLGAIFNAGTNAIDLSWTAATDNVGVTGYRIFRDGAAASIGTVAATAFSDLGQSGTHSYAVTAIDAAGNQSALSNIASATAPVADVTPPTAPSALTATASSTTTIELSWIAATDNIGVSGYQVFRDGGTLAVGTPTGITFSDIGLAPGSTHSYAVAAVDAAGNRSGLSNVASATTFAPPPPPTDVTPPTAPGGLTASISPASNVVSLSWTAATDNVRVTGYRIFRDGGATPISTVNATSFSETGQAGTHSYAVAAIDAAGNQSALSNTVSVTVTIQTQIALTSLTVSPTTVTAPANSTGAVTLNGAAPAGGVSITLRSGDTQKATVPTSVIVPAGASSATFVIKTLAGKLGGGQNPVTFTATLSGTSRTATLNILRP
jgi:uncharacterized delta-60 repeat protein